MLGRLVNFILGVMIIGGGESRSLKSTHRAHMCGGPKKVGGTKKLVD